MSRGGGEAAVIRCSELSKHFHSATSFADLLRGRLFGARVDALQRVSLAVRRGEILGLMGPNGAGKSTLLRLVAGLLLPDGGELEVLGQNVARAGAPFRRQVCFVNCDERSFSWRLTGAQNLLFFAALYGLQGGAAAERSDRALAMTGLEREAGRPVREYSTGMRQRLALARGLLGQPEIFLFDEPTRGVDPVTAARLRRFIRQEVVGSAHTALVATHSFSDVEDLCDRVLVLEQGRVVDEGPAARAAAMVGVEAEGARCAPVP
jgi:ABC-2 type transport system ATP-binding protein